MDTVLVIARVGKGWLDEHVGDVWIAKYGLKHQHDRAEPSIIPVGLLPDHWIHEKHLKIRNTI
jgi:hypothetical protein